MVHLTEVRFFAVVHATETGSLERGPPPKTFSDSSLRCASSGLLSGVFVSYHSEAERAAQHSNDCCLLNSKEKHAE
jgi:hypothetical protein